MTDVKRRQSYLKYYNNSIMFGNILLLDFVELINVGCTFREHIILYTIPLAYNIMMISRGIF